ncbi:MAG TPA: hypothetical protein PLV92_06725, partial [Pirellulaceae bacterium]|nr:hypothetical protein [Pirellulaceae bacterium]
MFRPHLPRVAFALASLICAAALSPDATRTFTLTSSASASEASQAAAQDSDQAKPAAKPEQDKPEPAKPEPPKPDPEKAAAEKAAPKKPQLEKPQSEKSEPEKPRQEAVETGKKPSSKLPWAKSRASTPANGTTSGADRRANTARDLLVNLEDSQLANFRDGEALSVNEEETLTRVLFRLPKFGPYDTFRLAHKVKVDDWAPFVDEPDSRRVQLFELRGRATNVERIDLLPEVAKRFE